MRMYRFPALLVLLLLGCQTGPSHDLQIAANLDERLAAVAEVEITADVSFLPENERKALEKLIQASTYLDDIFLRQVSPENVAIQEALLAAKDRRSRDALRFFTINFGPWDRFDENSPFIGSTPKPPGAGYYPADIDRAAFDSYLEAHQEHADSLKGLFTVVRREGDRYLAIPYSEMYRQWLEPAAKLMREAADLTGNASLQTFLRSRADAFFTDDYYESDMAWMDLDSPVEITIGPYEVYEDALYGYKAAYTSFVTVADPEESRKLAVYKSELPAMEANLPLPEHMKNKNRGTASPIRMVDVAFTAGDTKAGVQTIAFNLPNDERVREAKGSKKVLLRNVIQAKYDKILLPIAEKLLVASQLPLLDATAFSNQVLFHELSHGLGPGKIVVDGRETEVRLELKDLYSATEEAKADVMGLYNLFYMMDKGILSADGFESAAVTYLAGLFRSVRFGATSAHGKGVALQLNYLLEKGAIQIDADGKTAVHLETIRDGIRALVRDLCILQATGDYANTKALFEKYAVLSDTQQALLDSLGDIPIDLAPRYTLAESAPRLSAEAGN